MPDLWKLMPLMLMCLWTLSCHHTPPEDEGPGPPVGKPLPEGQVVSNVEFANPEVGWLTCSPGDDYHKSYIYKTVDSGKTWLSQYSRTFTQVQFIQDLAVVNERDVWAVADSGWILHSTDGGERWMEKRIPNIFGMEEIQMVSAAEGWAIGWNWETFGCGRGTNFVLHTTDAGTSWQTSYSASNGRVEGIRVLRENIWVVGGGLGEFNCFPFILHSASSGNMWEEQFATGVSNLHSVGFVDDQIAFAVGHGFNNGVTFIRTTNGGTQWDTLRHDFPDIDGRQLCVLSDSVLYLATNGNKSAKAGVLRSTDQGRSFKVEFEVTLSMGVLSIFFLNDSTGWAVGPPSMVKRKVRGHWID